MWLSGGAFLGGVRADPIIPFKRLCFSDFFSRSFLVGLNVAIAKSREGAISRSRS
jgi:hypothetical protein